MKDLITNLKSCQASFVKFARENFHKIQEWIAKVFSDGAGKVQSQFCHNQQKKGLTASKYGNDDQGSTASILKMPLERKMDVYLTKQSRGPMRKNKEDEVLAKLWQK